LVTELAAGAQVEHAVPTGRANDRAALAVMLLAAAGAVPLLMWYGRDQWFFLDEWDFLVNRSASSLNDLFRPYNGHWSTVPILAYRLNFRLWGIRTYVPYQLLVVLVHVALVLALWTLMRHLRVRAWICTGVAIFYLLFGSGYENIIWAFQIGFAGAALCGVLQLLLADHDGPIERRDWLGVAIGMVGLMCASAAIALTVTVGVAVMLRRGWRAAAFHVAPLAFAYVVWYAVTGRTSSVPLRFGSEALRFARELVRSTFMALGIYAPVAILVVALAIVGVVAGVVVPLRERRNGAASVPVGLLVGFFVYTSSAALARSVVGAASAGSPRYLHVGALFVLPFVALGGEALARRKTLLAIVPVVLLAIALPRNLDAFQHRNPLTLGREDIIAAAPHSRFFETAPARARYVPFSFARDVAPTVAWLRAAERTGRLPRLAHPDPVLVLRADADLALAQRRVSSASCAQPRHAVVTRLERGQMLVIDEPVNVAVVGGGHRAAPLFFAPSDGNAIVAVAGPIGIEATTADAAGNGICVRDGTGD
jgi:hypothetical protein